MNVQQLDSMVDYSYKDQKLEENNGSIPCKSYTLAIDVQNHLVHLTSI